MIIDAGRKEVDDLLGRMERKVAKEYRQASKEVEKKLSDYLEKFHERDMKKLQQRNNGEITQIEYQNWRVGQIATQNRWEALRDDLAQDYANANRIAESIVDGYMPEVYALSHNYATYEVEHWANIDTSYTLYDRQTVERLMRDNPQMLPKPGKRMSEDIRQGKVKRWNQKQVQSVMMQSLLQGEAIPKIAKRLASKVAVRDTKSAVRYARTMTTGAENAGRQDGYKRAVDMGVKMKQAWVAALDSRTRDEHRRLDGQQQAVGEPFEIDGYKIRFPGDPTAPGKLVWNCRCCLVAVVAGSNQDVADLKDRNTDKMGGMSYDEWKNAKRKKGKQEEAAKTGNQNKPAKPAQTATPKQEKPQTIADAKSFDDLRRYFENQYKIPIDASVDKLDFEQCKIAMEGIDASLKEFNGLAEHIKTIGTYASGYMCSDWNTIFYNPNYFKNGKFKPTQRGINLTYQAGAHETGHCLEGLLLNKKYQTDYERAMGRYDREISKQIVKEAAKNLKKAYPEYKKLGIKDIKRCISSYSLKNTSETLSEAVGSYITYKTTGVNMFNDANSMFIVNGQRIKNCGLRFSEEIVKLIKEGLE